MKPRSGLPAVWCTHLAKVLVGEQPCLLQPWLNARYVMERTGDGASLAKWKAEHTELLQQTIPFYKNQGWKCDVERYFKVEGTTAVLSGKADLILQRADSRPLIVDVKSGTPRETDIAQVAIEMVMIPLAWEAPTMIFDGLVIYKGHEEPVSPKQAAEWKPRIFALLKQLGTMPKPEGSPSEQACRWCDVPESECAVRMKPEMVPAAQTELW